MRKVIERKLLPSELQQLQEAEESQALLAAITSAEDGIEVDCAHQAKELHSLLDGWKTVEEFRAGCKRRLRSLCVSKSTIDAQCVKLLFCVSRVASLIAVLVVYAGNYFRYRKMLSDWNAGASFFEGEEEELRQKMFLCEMRIALFREEAAAQVQFIESLLSRKPKATTEILEQEGVPVLSVYDQWGVDFDAMLRDNGLL